MLVSHLKPMLDARRMSIRQFAKRIDYRFEAVRQLYNNDLLRIPAELIDKTCLELNIQPGELFSVEKGPAEGSGTTYGNVTKVQAKVLEELSEGKYVWVTKEGTHAWVGDEYEPKLKPINITTFKSLARMKRITRVNTDNEALDKYEETEEETE
jgi:DNA-binding Xre family transcriptional regulator